MYSFMQEHRNQILAAVLVLVLLCAGVVNASTTYLYYSTVTISNGGATDFDDRILVTVNTKALIDNSYIQSDADDVNVVVSGVDESVTVTNSTSSTSVWILEHTEIPAYSSTFKTLQFGNSTATRNQEWIASTSDTCTASDHASLDITDNLTIGGDFYLPSAPAGEVKLLEKDGAYGLYADSSNWIFRTYPESGSPTSTDLTTSLTTGSWTNVKGVFPGQPTVEKYSIGDFSGTSVYGRTGGDGTTRYSCIDGTTPLGGDDSEYISHGYGTSPDWIRFDVDWGVPSNATGITVTGYMRHWAVAGGYTQYRGFGVYKDGEGTDSVTGSQAGPGSSTYYNRSGSLDSPDGDAWIAADFDSDLKFAMYIYNSVGVAAGRITEAYLEIQYSLPSQLLINDVEQDSMAAPYSLTTTSTSIHLAEFAGKCDDLYIGDTSTQTPTLKLSLDFEPENISGTLVEDQSASANDVTYTLAANSSALTVTLGRTIVSDSTTTAVEAGVEESSGGALGSVELVDMFEETSGSNLPLYEFFDVMADTAGVPIQLFWIVQAILLTLVVGTVSFSFFKSYLITLLVTGCTFIAASVAGIIPMWSIYVYGIMGVAFWLWQTKVRAL